MHPALQRTLRLPRTGGVYVFLYETYCDTAIQGNTPALMCAYAFCGPDHMVFATDTPYDNELGARVYRETIAGVDAMPIDQASRFKIWEGNAAGYFDCPAAERPRWSRSRAEVDQGEA